MNRTLILARHAHREKTLGGLLDHGLSEKGHAQAKEIRKVLEKRLQKYPSNSIVFLSSPKKRCFQTLEQLADKIGIPIELDHSLDEGGDVEAKASQFSEKWLESEFLITIACSHGDIIPVITTTLLKSRLSLEKGAFFEIEYRGRSTVSLVDHFLS